MKKYTIISRTVVSSILTNKQYEIILLLSQNKEVMSSEQISDRLGISRKTIQRYIEIINQYLQNYESEIISMRGYGYLLQGNSKRIADMIHNLSAKEYDRRIKDIALRLTSKEYITIEEIGAQIDYSPSTLNKLIPEVKKYLDLFWLHFKSKPYYGLYLVGNEMDIRALVIDCAFKKTDYNELECLLFNIRAEEFEIIKEHIIDFLQKKQVVIADDDVTDLIMRTTVVISRCKQSCLMDPLEYVEENAIQQMLDPLCRKLNFVIPLSEIGYLSMYVDIINSGLRDNQQPIQEEINHFVIETLEKMKAIYGNFEINTQVQESLVLHLSLMFNRLNHKHFIKNPLLQDIKANYTLEMNYAITFGKFLEEYFHIQIVEDELGYLALYFALNHSQKRNMKRVIILCNYGFATSQLIKERIVADFPELEVIGIYPLYYLEVVMNQEIDLIISTVALDQTKVTKPYIVINQVIDESAMQNIKNLIQYANGAVALKYFHENAFFLLEAKTKDAAFLEMSEKMIEGGFFDEETVLHIVERENISSTDIGNLVAIPHTLIQNDQTSCIGIGILKKPILWDKEKVQIVFMVGLSAADLKEYNIFKLLFRMVKDVSSVNRLLENKSFDAFIRAFSKCL